MFFHGTIKKLDQSMKFLTLGIVGGMLPNRLRERL
jgi:hypothetical protein